MQAIKASFAFSFCILLPFASHQVMSSFGPNSSFHFLNFAGFIVYFAFMVMSGKQNYRYVLKISILRLVKKKTLLNLKERFKLEEELNAARAVSIHSSKMASLGEMAGNIAHEINNPLAVILGNTNVVLRQMDKIELEDARILKSIEKIEATTHRIGKIIDGLRNFSHGNASEESEVTTIEEVLRIQCL